jgi:hypothetical protein
MIFPQSLQANPRIVFQIMPRPLLNSNSFTNDPTIRRHTVGATDTVAR